MAGASCRHLENQPALSCRYTSIWGVANNNNTVDWQHANVTSGGFSYSWSSRTSESQVIRGKPFSLSDMYFPHSKPSDVNISVMSLADVMVLVFSRHLKKVVSSVVCLNERVSIILHCTIQNARPQVLVKQKLSKKSYSMTASTEREREKERGG